MVEEVKNRNRAISADEPAEATPDMKKKVIGVYSLISLMCLIISVLLLSLDLRLLAGCLVMAGASLLLVILRKTMVLIAVMEKSFIDASSSNEKKDDVISDFSHRIREPLNTLVTISEIFMDSGLQKKQKDLLETLIASTGNMVSTVNELSMKSASEISYKPKNNIRYNVLSSISNTIEFYRLKETANLDFILNRKDFHEYECQGDPVILKRILLDLFNTIGDQGGERTTKVTINLKKERVEGDRRYLGMRIQTDKNVIFINEEGTAGNLAARLISYTNGWYNQEFGDNCSVLNITMPFSYPAPENKLQAGSRDMNELTAIEKEIKELKDLRVLLVEDSLINQKIMLLTLRPLVKSVETASDGREALEKVNTTKFDLILMDIRMPLMDGLSAAEKIREQESGTNTRTPIIAITADAMIGDRERCLAAGIDDYISKPYPPSVLIERIREIIS